MGIIDWGGLRVVCCVGVEVLNINVTVVWIHCAVFKRWNHIQGIGRMLYSRVCNTLTLNLNTYFTSIYIKHPLAYLFPPLLVSKMSDPSTATRCVLHTTSGPHPVIAFRQAPPYIERFLEQSLGSDKSYCTSSSRLYELEDATVRVNTSVVDEETGEPSQANVTEGWHGFRWRRKKSGA